MDHGASRGGVVVPPLVDSINLSIKVSFNELEKSFKDFQLRSEESLSAYTPVIFSTQGADFGGLRKV